jgi:3-phosphoglycerate kinase
MKFLQEIDVKNKRILVRVDFNVSLNKEGRVLDDFRIRATLPTIEYLRQQNSKIILMTHFGRPKGKVVSEFSLIPVKERLEELLGQKILLAPDCIGEQTNKMAQDLKGGEILLLENLRFYSGEESNDQEFAKKLANLGELFVNDAFGVSHRAHASVHSITNFLPSCAGLLLEKEIKNLSQVRNNPKQPLCVVIGGSKISTKIKLIQSFLGKAQDIILGGALANTVLHAQGIAVGKSFIETEMVDEIKKLQITDTKIHLPLDAVLCANKEAAGLCRFGPVGKTGEDEMILDIGPDSEKLFASIISQAKMVLWNGPMGLFENEAFGHGTKAVAQAICDSGAFSVIGGGETVTYLESMGLIEKFGFVSTGGGAMMEFLSGDELPGISVLN